MRPNPLKSCCLLPHGVPRRRFLQCAAAVLAASLFGGFLTRDALAHPDHPRATCVAIAEDGRALTSDDLGRLIAWNLNTLKAEVFPHKHKIKAAYVSTHGNRALTAGYDGKVIIHNLKNPEDAKEFLHHQSPDGKREVWVAIFSPDGTQALSGANDGQILLWDPNEPGKPPREFAYPPKLNSKGPVAGLAFLPPANGKQRFLSTRGYGDVHLWEFDANQADVVRTFSHGNSRQVNAVVVQDGRATFLSGSFDKSLRLWDADDPKAKEVRAFQKEHDDWIWRVALSPGSDLAATASEDGTVKLWNIKKPDAKKSIASFPAGQRGSMGVAFTQDGKLVFTLDGSQPDKLIQVVNPELP